MRYWLTYGSWLALGRFSSNRCPLLVEQAAGTHSDATKEDDTSADGAATIGLMFVNVTGISLCFGGMSSLDTLCSQAFGARNFHLVGTWAQRATLMLTFIMCPIIICVLTHGASWWGQRRTGATGLSAFRSDREV